MSDQHEKPPIGPMPERLWKEERLKRLAKSVEEYVSTGHFRRSCTYIEKWCNEIVKLSWELEHDD